MRGALSYCLFGDGRRYLIGAIRNVEDARQFYPGWDVVIHAERGHPLIGRLKSLGAIVHEHDPEPGVGGAFWRFETITYRNLYDVVCCRDIDSILSQREVDAVDEWIRLDTALHTMADGLLRKNRRIMAGAFGIKTARSDSFAKDLNEWKERHRYGDDERFLQAKVWPAYRDNATCHTRKIRFPWELPFPTPRAASGGVAVTIRPGPPMRSSLTTYRIAYQNACLPGEIQIEPVIHGNRLIGITLAHIRALTEAIRRDLFPCIILESDAIWRADAHDLPEIEEPWLWIGLSYLEQTVLPDGRPKAVGGPDIPVRSVSDEGLIEMGNMYCTHGVVYTRREGVLRMLDAAIISLARTIPVDSAVIFMCNELGWKRPGLAIPWVCQAGCNRKYTDFHIRSTE